MGSTRLIKTTPLEQDNVTGLDHVELLRRININIIVQCVLLCSACSDI